MDMAIINLNDMCVTTIGRIDRAAAIFPEILTLDEYAGSFYKTICDRSRCLEIWRVIINDVALNGSGYTWFEKGDKVYILGADSSLLEQGVDQFRAKSNEVKSHPDRKVSLIKIMGRDGLSYEDIVWNDSVFLTYAETGFAPLSGLIDVLGLNESEIPELQNKIQRCNSSGDPCFPLPNNPVCCLPNAIVRDGTLHLNDVCEYLMRWWRLVTKSNLPSNLYLDFSYGRSYPDHLVAGIEKFKEVVAREDTSHCMDIHLFNCD